MAGIRQRNYRANGKTRSYWEISWYKDGKQHKKGGFASKIDAQIKLKEVTQDYSTDITLFELCYSYINEHCKLHCKQSTVNLYNGYLNNNLCSLHRNKARELTKRDFDLLILELKKEDISNKTINDIIGFLRSCYNYGIENEWLMRNVAKSIKKLPIQKRDIKFMTEQEMYDFQEVIKEFPLNKYLPLLTALHTGMRISELLALEWDDINFKKRLISVNKQYYKGNLSTPKTYTSIRNIDVPEFLLDELRKYHASSKILSKIVFCSSTGGYISQDKFVKSWFKKAMKTIGLNDYNFHCLRHTHATYLLSNGVSLKYVSERLGHSTPQTTLNVYNHVLPNVNDKAMNLLENLKKSHNKNIEHLSIA